MRSVFVEQLSLAIVEFVNVRFTCCPTPTPSSVAISARFDNTCCHCLTTHFLLEVLLLRWFIVCQSFLHLPLRTLVVQMFLVGSVKSCNDLHAIYANY